MSRNQALGLWKAGFDTWRMMAEAQTVFALRMAGMAGFWTLAPGETARMVAEKQDAFTQSALRSTSAMLRGQQPERVLAAAVRPLGVKTSANAKRLGRSYTRQLF